MLKKAKGSRAYFFEDPVVHKAIGIIMGLTSEVSVTRFRLDTIECLLEKNGTLNRNDIEAFQVDAAVSAERDAWRDRFLDNVLRTVHQEFETPDDGRANDRPTIKRSPRFWNKDLPVVCAYVYKLHWR